MDISTEAYQLEMIGENNVYSSVISNPPTAESVDNELRNIPRKSKKFTSNSWAWFHDGGLYARFPLSPPS